MMGGDRRAVGRWPAALSRANALAQISPDGARGEFTGTRSRPASMGAPADRLAR